MLRSRLSIDFNLMILVGKDFWMARKCSWIALTCITGQQNTRYPILDRKLNHSRPKADKTTTCSWYKKVTPTQLWATSWKIIQLPQLSHHPLVIRILANAPNEVKSCASLEEKNVNTLPGVVEQKKTKAGIFSHVTCPTADRQSTFYCQIKLWAPRCVFVAVGAPGKPAAQPARQPQMQVLILCKPHLLSAKTSLGCMSWVFLWRHRKQPHNVHWTSHLSQAATEAALVGGWLVFFPVFAIASISDECISALPAYLEQLLSLLSWTLCLSDKEVTYSLTKSFYNGRTSIRKTTTVRLKWMTGIIKFKGRERRGIWMQVSCILPKYCNHQWITYDIFASVYFGEERPGLDVYTWE